MSKNEINLIQQAKKGDPAAFAEIYDRHQPAIYRYIFYRVGDATTAEDLTSDVFVRLVERIDHFVYRDRPLLAWLYTIARNLITDHLRQASRAAAWEPYEQLATDADNPEHTAERDLVHEQLIAALAHLTEDQRQVIILKFIEGQSNAEVARILGKPVGAVKSLQHRALAALRRIIEREAKNER